MVFLLVFMLTFSLVLGNLLLEFFVDPNASDRYWVWERYGTTLRAMYTLFEITFSGSWPNSTRPLIEKVNAGLVLFFVVYITVVAFGLIRVITAVFLKDTLDAAANDADHQVTLRLQKKADYAQKLEAIFGAIDREGNGLITEERLVEALDYPVVRAYFQTLDLDVYESKAFGSSATTAKPQRPQPNLSVPSWPSAAWGSPRPSTAKATFAAATRASREEVVAYEEGRVKDAVEQRKAEAFAKAKATTAVSARAAQVAGAAPVKLGLSSKTGALRKPKSSLEMIATTPAAA
eukprot:g30046.t1